MTKALIAILPLTLSLACSAQSDEAVHSRSNHKIVGAVTYSVPSVLLECFYGHENVEGFRLELSSIDAAEPSCAAQEYPKYTISTYSAEHRLHGKQLPVGPFNYEDALPGERRALAWFPRSSIQVRRFSAGSYYEGEGDNGRIVLLPLESNLILVSWSYRTQPAGDAKLTIEQVYTLLQSWSVPHA